MLPIKGKFINEEVDNIFLVSVSQLIADVGRNVIIHKKPIIEDCPNCYFDSIRKRSNNIYTTTNSEPLGPLNIPFANGTRCPVCHGKGKLNTPKSQTIICAVLTGQKELRELERFHGKVLNSLVETICLSEHITVLSVAEKATIDGFVCKRFSVPVTLGLTAENQAFVKVIWHRISI